MAAEATQRRLPRGWAWATVDDTGRYLNGFAFKPTDWSSDGTPIIRIQNLTECDRKPNRTKRQIPEVYSVEEGDLLVSWSATLDAFIWRGERALLNQHIFKVDPRINRNFLYHLLRWSIQQMIKSEHLHGSTMAHINRGPFLRHVIPLPPLPEQARIASRIDELFGEIEAGEQELAKAREGLDAYRRALLKAAVTGELTRDWRAKNPPKESGVDFLKRIIGARRAEWEHRTIAKLEAKGQNPKDDSRKRRYVQPLPSDTNGLPALPRGWVWASLDQLSFESSYGTSTKCSVNENGMPVLRIPNVRNGAIDESNLKFSTIELMLDPGDELAPGDFLIVRTNGSEDLIGRGGLVLQPTRRPSYFASYLIRFRLLGGDPLWRWIAFYWGSALIRERVRNDAATSAGQYNISQSRLATFPVPVPGEAELAALLPRLDEETQAVRELDMTLSSAASIHGIRQSILAAAFSGKLVPQDPSDEPASVLLERLRATKAAAGEPQRRTARKPLSGRGARSKQPRPKALEGIAK